MNLKNLNLVELNACEALEVEDVIDWKKTFKMQINNNRLIRWHSK